MDNIALENAEIKDSARVSGNYAQYVIKKHGNGQEIQKGQKAINSSAAEDAPHYGEIKYFLAKNTQTGKVENIHIAGL